MKTNRYNKICPTHILLRKEGINIDDIRFVEKTADNISIGDIENIENELYKIFAKYFK